MKVESFLDFQDVVRVGFLKIDPAEFFGFYFLHT